MQDAAPDERGPHRGWSRPELPPGFDASRAAERRADPEGWRFPEAARTALEEAILGRRDIRRFRADPVPSGALRRLLEAAHAAPSVGLMQPWRFIVIRSRETRLAVRAMAERERLRQAPRLGPRASHYLEQKVEGVLEAPLGVCVCCDRGRGEEILGRGTIPDTDLYSTACAIQNLWLAARAEGLGVGWVSFYRPPELRRLLGIPERVEPVAYLCVGYPDERPVRPGLESAGWAARRPLDDLVFEERWQDVAATAAEMPPPSPRRRVPPAPRGLPAPLEGLVIGAPDPLARLEVRDRADELVKPAGSLGVLETLAERWGALTGAPPPAPLRAGVLVLAGDHGVAARGTSLFRGAVSAEVAAALARGDTAAGVLARAGGHRLVIADIGLSGPAVPGVRPCRVADGSADITEGAAMTGAELERALTTGAELAGELLRDRDCLVVGEVGIGNTTSASALAAALLGMSAADACGRGTGLDAAGLERKRRAVARALEVNGVARRDPLEALRRLGGLELAGMVGAMLAAAALRRPVILDGFATGTAALVATGVRPALREHLLASHRSTEPAHGVVLEELGLEPLLDLRLRLGEASGGLLALPLIEAAGRLHREMATFAQAGVSRPRGRGPASGATDGPPAGSRPR